VATALRHNKAESFHLYRQSRTDRAAQLLLVRHVYGSPQTLKRYQHRRPSLSISYILPQPRHRSSSPISPIIINDHHSSSSTCHQHVRVLLTSRCRSNLRTIPCSRRNAHNAQPRLDPSLIQHPVRYMGGSVMPIRGIILLRWFTRTSQT